MVRMVSIEFFSLKISYCLCMFIMLSLEIEKHEEGKLSVSASVSEWASDLVPVFVRSLICKLRKVFLHCHKLPNLLWDIGNVLLCLWSIYSCQMLVIDWVSYALLHKCMCIPFAFCLRRMQPVFSSTEDAVAADTRQCAVDQRVSGGRQLHLFPSSCQPKCVCYLTSEWRLFSQQLQMRLQEKEKEVDNLTIQIQAEKVVPFFCVLLSAPPSSSPKYGFVFVDGYFLRDDWLAYKTRQTATNSHTLCGFCVLLIRHPSQGWIGSILFAWAELPFCLRFCWFLMSNSSLFLCSGSKRGMWGRRSDIKGVMPQNKSFRPVIHMWCKINGYSFVPHFVGVEQLWRSLEIVQWRNLRLLHIIKCSFY